MAWNPEQYLQFAQPRLPPAMDLLARVALASPARVCDLGCGTGSATRAIAQRWPRAEVTGVDDSDTMLAQAARDGGAIRWVRAGIAGWVPERPLDLVYSNAALHWLPDHGTLFPRLLDALAPGGVLAVQMPRNFEAPSHTLIERTVRDGPWRARLEPLLRPVPVGEPRAYHALLAPRCASVDIWETEYLQVLHGPDPVKEWTKGTWLKPLLDALDAADRPAFEEAYARRLRVAYPAEPDGSTLFPFRRLFIVATRA